MALAPLASGSMYEPAMARFAEASRTCRRPRHVLESPLSAGLVLAYEVQARRAELSGPCHKLVMIP